MTGGYTNHYTNEELRRLPQQYTTKKQLYHHHHHNTRNTQHTHATTHHHAPHHNTNTQHNTPNTICTPPHTRTSVATTRRTRACWHHTCCRTVPPKCVHITFHGYVSRGLLANARIPTPLSILVDPVGIKRYRARAMSELSIYTTRHSTRIQSHSVPMIEAVCERVLSCRATSLTIKCSDSDCTCLSLCDICPSRVRGCWASLPIYKLREIQRVRECEWIEDPILSHPHAHTHKTIKFE